MPRGGRTSYDHVMITPTAYVHMVQAGLTVAGSGTFDRAETPGSWRVPDEIGFDGVTLTWDQTMLHSHMLERPAGLVDALLDLAEAAGPEIAQFARTYGVVVLCDQHQLPIEHWRPTSGLPTPCTPLGGSTPYLPVEWYPRFSRQVGALLRLAAAVHLDTPGQDEDWLMVLPDMAGDRTTITKTWKERRVSETERVDEDREVLGEILDAYLRVADAHLTFEWTNEFPTYELRTPTIFSAVVVAVVYAISRTDGVAVCSACGRPYVPKRRPAPGRRSYCPRPECSTNARIRDANREMRARKRRQGDG